ncbi:hypothetical protein AVEN_161398-1 [Araneus ventricosus]|uniref:Uncharacterized protein n=1 Tax=Araneus ventricosus TaxID=182803 RepID=A0A4Y2FL52_ARAVE|nr:hypothetical protein AVEN_161398-1 [Araneus ventricosus]
MSGVFGCDDLLLRSRFQDCRDPGSEPDSTEDSPEHVGLVRAKSDVVSNVLPMVWRGDLKRGCQLRCRSHHPTIIQNCEVRSKVAIVLFKIGRSN